MAITIPPVTPLIGVSPTSAFDSRNVLVPLPVNNPKVQEILTQNDGNKGSNPDLFASELNSNRDVVVPINAKTPEIDEKLKENGGNTLDEGTETTTDTGDIHANDNVVSPLMQRLRLQLREQDLAIPLNDNFATLEPLTRRDTNLSLESVLTLQETPDTTLQNFTIVNIPATQNSFNIYSHIINALQGGFNEAIPFVDNDNRVEFEV